MKSGRQPGNSEAAGFYRVFNLNQTLQAVVTNDNAAIEVVESVKRELIYKKHNRVIFADMELSKTAPEKMPYKSKPKNVELGAVLWAHFVEPVRSGK